MPVSFHILADRGLVVVRYSGFAAIDDTLEATKDYVAHPDYAPGQRQLVDLSAITGYEKDYARFIMMQAAKAGRFTQSGTQTLVVYSAATPIALELATLFIKSWDDVHAVVPMIQYTQSDALALLGESENSIDALLRAVDGPALQ